MENKQKTDIKSLYDKKPFSVGVRSCDIGLTLNTKAIFFDAFMRDAILTLSNGVVGHAFIVGNNGDIIEALGGGVTTTKLADYVKSDQCVLIFRNMTITDNDKSNILSYAYGSVGRRYDYTGLLHFLFKGINADKKDNFCSENCFESFATRDIKVSTKDNAQDTTPQDILDFMYLQGALTNDTTKWTLADNQNFNLTKILSFLMIKNGGV